MLITRDVVPDDLNLIRDSFVNGAKQIEMTAGLDPAILRSVIDKAILFGWTARVLCDDGAKDEIMSWIVCEPGHRRLLWLSRKPRYKGNGLGLRLLAETLKTGPVFSAIVNPRQTMLFAEHGYDVKLRPYIIAEVMTYE